jgi:hypothetical protein
MNVEQLVEWELAGETEVLGENLPPSSPQAPHDITLDEYSTLKSFLSDFEKRFL